jgi:hypothetical protein
MQVQRVLLDQRQGVLQAVQSSPHLQQKHRKNGMKTLKEFCNKSVISIPCM